MKLNKKGFVSTAVLYSLLLLFLALILGLLALLSNRKQILDKLKGDIKAEINKVNVYKYYENGTEIYYNPVTGKICGDYIEENSKTETKEGCLKWYIFNDDKNKATVNMILDHNTSGNVAWASLEDYIEDGGTEEEYGEKGNNLKGPLTANKRLNEDTENWKEKARLISTDEIAEIIKNNSWDKNSLLYFDTNSSSVPNPYKGIYAWLYDNTYQCTKYGCNISDDIKYEYGNAENENYVYGYWTSSITSSGSSNAWDVDWNGRLASSNVSINSGYGVRPVITISKKQIEKETYKLYANGTAVYYNPVTGEKCTDYKEDNSKTGTKEGCLKWYTFNDSKFSDSVNMILDHNTTISVAWKAEGTNTQMVEAKTALENDTANWELKNTARLITADELAKITGNTVFNSKTSSSSEYFNLETNTTIAPTTYKGTYAWLYEYTQCKTYGCNKEDASVSGYWTESTVYGDEYLAWVIQYIGNVGLGHINVNNKYGIRPIITINKNKL